MTEKIRPEHLRRAAYVYVRQSSAHQVRHHQESRQRQYALADRARALGFAETVVIDVADREKTRFPAQASTGLIDEVSLRVIPPRHHGADAGGYAPAD